ncbi:MAG: NTP transferase domain-containing protein [Clostridia bacterium]|nr:NTP transferase domain-containing protein [Clostridia bacterium]
MTEYLTARAVRRAFEESGKRHLILTGGRKSGKTTLMRALCPGILPGVTTWAVPHSAAYLQDNMTGETVQIGVFDESLPGPENRMRMRKDGFLTAGITALKRSAENEWLTVDEIGYLETECEEYCAALGDALEHQRVIAVVRKQEIPFLTEILGRDDVFAVDLDDPYGKPGCVIMASGMGKRFSPDGSVNKLTADFLGHPLIRCVSDTTEGLFHRRVVVTRHRDVAVLCAENEVIFHDLPHRSDTVRLGTEAMADTDCCLFCQGDQPLIERDTISAMLLLSKHDRESIIRASRGGNAASPVLFPRWAYEELKNLPEGKGGGWLAKKYPDRVKTLNVFHPAELMDADAPSDLDELEEIYREELS